MLKFDYFKNEKSFRSEIKAFFLVSQVLSFRHTKQTSKNVADTTFKYLKKRCHTHNRKTTAITKAHRIEIEEHPS